MTQVRRLQPFVATIKEKTYYLTLPLVVVTKTKSGEKNLEHRHRRRVYLSVKILASKQFAHCTARVSGLVVGKK